MNEKETKMEIREWPKPYVDLIVEFEDGEKCHAVYTGDGWIFDRPLLSGFPKKTVVSYTYVNKKDDNRHIVDVNKTIKGNKT